MKELDVVETLASTVLGKPAELRGTIIYMSDETVDVEFLDADGYPESWASYMKHEVKVVWDSETQQYVD